jgi:phosphohistidine phosphatase
MDLCLIRHGAAGDRPSFARTGRPDSERPLTSGGCDKMLSNARGLRTLVRSFDAIVTSPYKRTVQTAAIVAREFNGPQPEPLEALAPDGRLEDVLAWLRKHRDYESVAVVGHEPGLSSLLALCVSGSAAPLGELRKGGVCMLVWDGAPAAGKAKLSWLLSPRVLRRLAR